MLYKNKPSDLKINYKVNTYEKIEEIFDLRDGEQPLLHLMLALMGYKNEKRIELDTKDSQSDKSHEFSLRTVYNRNSSDLDASYGLVSILDNLDLTYEEVINNIAFERTSINNTPFLKMKNVKTFYEYMLSGIEYFEKMFFLDGKNLEKIAFNIHDFLIGDQSDINDILIDLITEEENVLDD